ncbi:hypothetical protein [Nonomuraea sp. LPB2021202275-12-8]|uniref:hypothetical protein n=1 Tax=Nonomuraea sp. LPB2021202275-12-8 TaxID=3120159 RepID=UPI00300C1661
MRTLLKALGAGLALACLTMFAATGPAQAASGRLTLSGGTASRTVVYDTCQPPAQSQPQTFTIETFVNEPLPGCQAVLINSAGASKVLCVGRGTVPAEFRNAALVRVQPGTAPPCAF